MVFFGAAMGDAENNWEGSRDVFYEVGGRGRRKKGISGCEGPEGQKGNEPMQ